MIDFLRAKPEDSRPKYKGWAPGGYFGVCHTCSCTFTGDKRASMCADCAYGDNMPKYVPPSERSRREGKGVLKRLESIEKKLCVLMDKEWDSLDDGDNAQLEAIRGIIATMIPKYR